MALSLGVSLAAMALASPLGILLGAVLAICRFPGRRVLVIRPAGQAAIAACRVNGEQLFHPSAAAPK